MQSLKVFDSSVENLASGAWSAFGNAWKGGTQLVNKYVLNALNVYLDSCWSWNIDGQPRSRFQPFDIEKWCLIYLIYVFYMLLLINFLFFTFFSSWNLYAMFCISLGLSILL